MQQRLGAAPLAQQRQGLRELHLVIDLGEANHVTAAATAVAVEKVFVGIHQEAWFVISMQRTQPHPSATAERPRRAPIMRLQIAHQGNLLFQVVESLAIHGLLASMGRIRQSAPKSQARMVGARKKKSSRAWRFTDFLPRWAEYGRARRNPRQGWWAPVKSAGRRLRPSPRGTRRAGDAVPIGGEWMDRASATDLCSPARLAQRKHLRRYAHTPAVGNAS